MNKAMIQKIIDRFGEPVQINKIQEEALELALVLNQRNCPTKDPSTMEAQLYDELADMKIMMAQAELLFDSDRINERVKYKLKRFEEKYLSPCDAMGHYGGGKPDGICPKCNKNW